MSTDSNTRKTSISYPEDLHKIIEEQVDAGINDSFSEWWQEAAYLRLSLQGLSAEASAARVTPQDSIDPNEIREELANR